jgi:hypothetical protein
LERTIVLGNHGAYFARLLVGYGYGRARYNSMVYVNDGSGDSRLVRLPVDTERSRERKNDRENYFRFHFVSSMHKNFS